MKFLRLRTLEAPDNPLLQAYTAATGRTAQDAIGDTSAADASGWVELDPYQWGELFAAMAGQTETHHRTVTNERNDHGLV